MNLRKKTWPWKIPWREIHIHPIPQWILHPCSHTRPRAKKYRSFSRNRQPLLLNKLLIAERAKIRWQRIEPIFRTIKDSKFLSPLPTAWKPVVVICNIQPEGHSPLAQISHRDGLMRMHDHPLSNREPDHAKYHSDQNHQLNLDPRKSRAGICLSSRLHCLQRRVMKNNVGQAKIMPVQGSGMACATMVNEGRFATVELFRELKRPLTWVSLA